MELNVARMLRSMGRPNAETIEHYREAEGALERLNRCLPWIERRLWRRTEVAIPVQVRREADGMEFAALIKDISAKGFGLGSVDGLAIGDVVTIGLEFFNPIVADVVWIDGARAGVQVRGA